MSIYGIANKLWQLMPFAFRKRISKVRIIARIKQATKRSLYLRATHDEKYDYGFYAAVSKWDLHSSRIMAESIMKLFAPESIIDVGCGTGALLKAFGSLGVKDLVGVELSDAALSICHSKGIKAIKCDLTTALDLPGKETDMACCFEVAEHLPAECSLHLVQLLSSKSNVIVISAATPGQGGTDHINEQPHSFWIDRFRDCNCAYDERYTNYLRDLWKASNTLVAYHNNVMVFRRGGSGVE